MQPDQFARLRFVEAQRIGVDQAELLPRQSARKGRRRRQAADEDPAYPRRQFAEEVGQHALQRCARRQFLIVVEDQRPARRQPGQHEAQAAAQPVGQVGQMVAAQRLQRRRRRQVPAPERLERVGERRRVAVARIEAQPVHRRGVTAQPGRDQRRLARARRCAQPDAGAGRQDIEAREQPRSVEHPAQAWRGEPAQRLAGAGIRGCEWGTHRQARAYACRCDAASPAGSRGKKALTPAAGAPVSSAACCWTDPCRVTRAFSTRAARASRQPRRRARPATAASPASSMAQVAGSGTGTSWPRKTAAVSATPAAGCRSA